MAELDRDLCADAEIQAAAAAHPEAVATLAAQRTATLLPTQRHPVSAAIAPTPDAGEARRLDAVLRLVECREAAAWIDAGDLLRLRGEPVTALAAYETALQIQPDVREALLGRAEALLAAGGPERLTAAMAIHRRLLAGRDLEPDASRRDHAWWLSQLRQLQILQASDRFDAKATMRLNRLRAVDPALGGAAFAEAFARLPASQTP
jgi:tetratricopeptide (TPR) repeat protein